MRKRSGAASPPAVGCCRIEGLVAVDDRGQMVLPKEVRSRAGIKAGDKLALVAWESQGEPCCLVLIKAERLTAMVQSLLGPLVSGLTK